MRLGFAARVRVGGRARARARVRLGLLWGRRLPLPSGHQLEQRRRHGLVRVRAGGRIRVRARVRARLGLG